MRMGVGGKKRKSGEGWGRFVILYCEILLIVIWYIGEVIIFLKMKFRY